MPIRQVSGDADFALSEGAGWASWQAAGLTLAALGAAVFSGPGALLGALIVVAVIFVFARLRAYSPRAHATADLIRNVVGERSAVTTELLQLTAYMLFTVNAAVSVSLQIAGHVSDSGGFDAILSGWQWPALSVAVAVLVVLLAYWLSDRAVASLVGVLALIGVLIFFYLALAVVARVLAGTDPLDTGLAAPRSGLGEWNALILAALGFTGVEIATVRNRRLRSTAWPMGIAVAALTICALTVWLAVHLGGSGADISQFGVIAAQFYPEAGGYLLEAGIIAVVGAVALTFAWAAIRVSRRNNIAFASALAVTVALLAVAECRNVAGINDKLSHVAPMILVVVYVIAAEANARIPLKSEISWWVRIVLAASLVAVILVPLLYADFAGTAVWSVAIVAVVVAAAYTAASLSARRSV